MNRSIHARAVVAAVLFAGLHCDRSKPTPTAENTEPLTKQAPSATPSAAPPVEDMASAAPAASVAPPKDAGPDEWYACKKQQDCVLVSEGRCCAPCDPVLFAGYTAVNAKHKAQFVAHEGCSSATCPVPIAGLPRSDSNFFPLLSRRSLRRGRPPLQQVLRMQDPQGTACSGSASVVARVAATMT